MRSGSALVKACIVAGVALVLLVPLAMLGGLVEERMAMRESAFTQVAQGWGGRQLLGGPVLMIPVTTLDPAGKPIMRPWYVLPESLEIGAQLVVQNERRAVGIYEVPVYITKLRISSEFDVGRQIARLMKNDPAASAHLETARLILPMEDPRGLRDVQVTENDIIGAALEPSGDFVLPVLAAPARGDAGLDTGRRKFTVSLEVAGTRALSFLPLARNTRVQMSGNWPHPGFTSGFLPVDRKIADDRFEARWQILDLNRSYGGSWFSDQVSLENLRQSAFGVDLVQPVDLYQRAERAVKYGFLFISLSLLTLFLWERLAGRPLHPIQYGLMGLALSVFYLLLLALAEHIGFAAAYTVAAIALCALLGIYLAGAMQSRAAGLGSAGMFGAVYGLLYLLVTSENYALLTGALALFGLLATVMLLTRTLDWYSTEQPSVTQP